MTLPQIRSLFLKTLIGCLFLAATVAVIAVLAGGMSDVLSRALWTVVLVGLHAFAGLAFTQIDGIAYDDNDESVDRPAGSLKLTALALFGIVIFSFITSVFHAWQIIDGSLAWRFYQIYFIFAFAILHADVLLRARGHSSTTDTVITANFVVMALVVVLMSTFVLMDWKLIAEILIRILGAAAIIDGTLTLTAIIMHKMYLEKHPELVKAPPVQTVIGPDGQPVAVTAPPRRRSGLSIIFIIIGIYVVFQIIGAIVSFGVYR